MGSGGISYLDLIIAVILLIFIYKGFQRGFTDEAIRIVGTMVSLTLAIRFMSNISRYIIGAVEIPPIVAIIVSFSLIFLVSIFVFRYISEKMKKAINFSVGLGGADKIVGGALGLCKGAIIVSLITILISIFSFVPIVQRHISESQLFDPMRRVAPMAYEFFKTFIPKSKPFLEELEENLSGVSIYNRGESTDRLIEFYQKK